MNDDEDRRDDEPTGPVGATAEHRTPTDRLAVVTGATFTFLGAMTLADELGLPALEGRWLTPFLLIGLGAAGLASGVRRD